MSKFVTLHGFGGTNSGVELNFNVVGGTTQPYSATENTIWVQTDVPISGWKFSSSEPENAIEGIVWIYTGSSSGVGFDIIENVKVYPISAKQYVNGAFVRKDSKIYTGGSWKNVRYMLYNRGDQCIGITGGWTGSGLGWAYSDTAKAATFASDRIILDTGSTSSISAAQTGNKIDFTGFTKILFLYKNITITNNRAFEGTICSGRNVYSNNVAAADTYDGSVNEEKVAEIPLSSLQGQYYPSIHCGQSRKCEVYEIWLE